MIRYLVYEDDKGVANKQFEAIRDGMVTGEMVENVFNQFLYQTECGRIFQSFDDDGFHGAIKMINNALGSAGSDFIRHYCEKGLLNEIVRSSFVLSVSDVPLSLCAIICGIALGYYEMIFVYRG